MMRRNACPLCGCRTQTVHDADSALLVCDGCAETLYPEELVRRATEKTRTHYLVSNHIASD
jgi:hypothetical protein